MDEEVTAVLRLRVVKAVEVKLSDRVNEHLAVVVDVTSEPESRRLLDTESDDVASSDRDVEERLCVSEFVIEAVTGTVLSDSLGLDAPTEYE